MKWWKIAIAATALATLTGCAQLDALRGEAGQRADESRELAGKLDDRAAALRDQADATPDEAEAQALREQAERLDLGAAVARQAASEAQRVADRGWLEWAGGVVAGVLPPPWGQLVLLGTTVIAGAYAGQQRRGLETLAASSVALAKRHPQVEQAISRDAETLRTQQTVAAKRAIDKAQAKAQGRA